MAAQPIKTSSSIDELKYDVKTTFKDEFEKAVKQICPEDALRKIPNLSDDFSENLSKVVVTKVENPLLDKKLAILYEREKKFLDILKEYKEEIKFAYSLQAEIRKEQATFFSSTLKEVCTSLKETQIDPKCQIEWICELVSSYTSSLQLSSRLATEHVINLVGEIQENIRKAIEE